MFLIFLTFLLNLYAVTPCHNAFEIVTGVADVATGTPLAREEIHKLLEEDFKKDVVNAGYQILNSNFASGGHATQMLVEKNGKKYLFKRLNKDIHEADKFLKNEYKMARRAYESEPGPKHHFANVEKIKINGEEVLRSEFILGETLYLKMVGHLSEEDKLKIAKQLITAVQHAHDVGVIHRDLKPANIYVDNNNNVYLLDFGIAALKGGFPEIGETAKNLGTLQYAPENQIYGRPAEVSQDIHALNIILMELMTENRLYGDARTALIERQKPPSSKMSGGHVLRFKFAPEDFGATAPLAAALYCSSVRSATEKGLLMENALKLPEDKYYELHGKVLRDYLKETKNYVVAAEDILASKGLIQNLDKLITDKSELAKVIAEAQRLKNIAENFTGDKERYGFPNTWLHFHIFENKVKELKKQGKL